MAFSQNLLGMNPLLYFFSTGTIYKVRVLEILKKKTTEEVVSPIILFHLFYFISKNSLKSVLRH